LVCGTSVTYNHTNKWSSSPTYQWKVNGTNVAQIAKLILMSHNGDQVSVVLTSSDACAQTILNFSWNDNTKAITDSDYGIDALSGFGQYSTGRVGGTLSLAPITSTKTDIDLTFDGTAPEFNSEGIDYSISYLRKENESELFTRGSSLINRWFKF
jgi:flagellar capping protein FliD